MATHSCRNTERHRRFQIQCHVAKSSPDRPLVVKSAMSPQGEGTGSDVMMAVVSIVSVAVVSSADPVLMNIVALTLVSIVGPALVGIVDEALDF